MIAHQFSITKTHKVGFKAEFKIPAFASSVLSKLEFNYEYSRAETVSDTITDTTAVTVTPQKVTIGPCKSRDLKIVIFETATEIDYAIDFEIDVDATIVHVMSSPKKLSEYIFFRPETPFSFDYDKNGIKLGVEYKNGKVILKNMPAKLQIKKQSIEAQQGPEEPLELSIPCH